LKWAAHLIQHDEFHIHPERLDYDSATISVIDKCGTCRLRRVVAERDRSAAARSPASRRVVPGALRRQLVV